MFYLACFLLFGVSLANHMQARALPNRGIESMNNRSLTDKLIFNSVAAHCAPLFTSDIGDFNGDNTRDILIGCPTTNKGIGQVFVVYGIPYDSVDLLTFSTSIESGLLVHGSSPSFGTHIQAVGDLNGDQLADILVAGTGTSDIHAIFGSSKHDADIYVENIRPSLGFKIYGFPADWQTRVFATVGDMNGDNLSDIVLGLPMFSTEHAVHCGVVMVLFSPCKVQDIDIFAAASSSSSVSTANHSTSLIEGIRIYGALAGDRIGSAVAGGQDVNNDGMNDLLIGAPHGVYVVFGTNRAFDHSLDAREGESARINGQGYNIYSTDKKVELGRSVSFIGDVNSDGQQDFAFSVVAHTQPSVSGEHNNTETQQNRVVAVVIYGTDSLNPATSPLNHLQLDAISPERGFLVRGLLAIDQKNLPVTVTVTVTVAAAGDVNNDGVADLLISNTQGTNTTTSTIVILYGTTERRTTVELQGLESGPTTGCVLTGTSTHHFVSSAGSTNAKGALQLLKIDNNGMYLVDNTDVCPQAIAPARLPSSQPTSVAHDPSTGLNTTLDGAAGAKAHIQSRTHAHLLNLSPTAIPTALPTSNRCPGGTMYNDRCFYSAGSRTWVNCQTHCSNNGWRMLCVDSLNTNNFLQSTFSNFNKVWLGLNDRGTENSFAWSGGCSPSDYRNWNSGEPNNYGSGEDCVEMSLSEGVWNDNPCGSSFGCGCESTWTAEPTIFPTVAPSALPSGQPSSQPSAQPSNQPSQAPTTQPSRQPSAAPSAQPSNHPSSQPTAQPSRQPTQQPTGQPSSRPTTGPSAQPSRQPTTQPTRQPSGQPTRQPSSQPTAGPSAQPSRQPSSQPSRQPTNQPTRQPSSQPTARPSAQPTRQPSSQPSRQPSAQPSNQPSSQPSLQPSAQPSRQPTNQPTRQPSTSPTTQPSGQPSSQPSRQPSSQPSTRPSGQPTRQPTSQPSAQPSESPSSQPSAQPSAHPTGQPSSQPTRQPTRQPSGQPSSQPSGQPSSHPSMQPSGQPTRQPTEQPTGQPSGGPTSQPSRQPSTQPSTQPSFAPSSQPSRQPSVQPSRQPISRPSTQPSGTPSAQPSTQPSGQPSGQPTAQPTEQPSGQPSRLPTSQPSRQPSRQPTTQPTHQPSVQPSVQPTSQPTTQPSERPSAQPTQRPTSQPSVQPTALPSAQPSQQPTDQPTRQPTAAPSSQPSAFPSSQASKQPSAQPSMQPSGQPSMQPTCVPSAQPSMQPSAQPSQQPLSQPTRQPTLQPSCQPSSTPSTQPSCQPSAHPSTQPSGQPTRQPSSAPTVQPSNQPTAQPTNQPSTVPSAQPSRQPSTQPTALPSSQPTKQSTTQPSSQPSRTPSSQPSTIPSKQPSRQPSGQPTRQPTAKPTAQPLTAPSSQPSRQPSAHPSAQSSSQPTRQSTGQPSNQPFSQPSKQPSRQPTCQPSSLPTKQPSTQPTRQPSGEPSLSPSAQPFAQPTQQPTSQPSVQPTGQPTRQPSAVPSRQPTAEPSCQPSVQPSAQPSWEPSGQPSAQPTAQPNARPIVLPTSQPSTRPTAQPSGSPSRQPSRQPSSQPSRQPTQQPRADPTGQPSGAPSERPTSEWAVTLEQASRFTLLTSLKECVWVCSATGQCETLSAATGRELSQLNFPGNIDTIFGMEDTNAVVIVGRNVSLAKVTSQSQVSTCKVSQNTLLCDFVSYADVGFVATAYLPRFEYFVHLSQPARYPGATVFDISASTAQGYVYSMPSMGSVVLSHIQSPPNFVGSFVAGTGIRAAGDLSPCIVLGKLRSDFGGLSAMYLTPMSSSILNSAELVNAMALEYENPDSFIAGGLQLSDGAGMHAYVIRANGLFESILYCVRYRLRTAGSRRGLTSTAVSSSSVARGVIHMEGALYTIVDGARSISVLRTLPNTGQITKQVNIAARNGSISCDNMTATGLYITMLCALAHDSFNKTMQSTLLISFDRDLSFKKLPAELVRDDADLYESENVPFLRTVFAVTTTKATTSVSRAGDTQPPSVMPTRSPSWRPSSVPSGQPSSSPTAAPSVSPQPTSHPSTGGPTNTYKPTVKPTQRPSRVPSRGPTVSPTVRPTVTPTASPSDSPTTLPSTEPSVGSTVKPSRAPTIRPSRTASVPPSIERSAFPSVANTIQVPVSSDKQKDESLDLVIGASVVGAVFLCWFAYVVHKCWNVCLAENAKRKKKEEFLAREEEIWLKMLQRQKEILLEAERAAVLRRKFKTEEQQRMFALASVNESSGEEDASASSSDDYSVSSNEYTLSSLHSSELSDSRTASASVFVCVSASEHCSFSATESSNSGNIQSLHSSDLSDSEAHVTSASVNSNEDESIDSPRSSEFSDSDQESCVKPSVRPASAIVERTVSSASSGDISSLHSSERRSTHVENPSHNEETCQSDSEPSDGSVSSVSGIETSSSEDSVMSPDSGTEESELDAMEAGRLVK